MCEPTEIAQSLGDDAQAVVTRSDAPRNHLLQTDCKGAITPPRHLFLVELSLVAKHHVLSSYLCPWLERSVVTFAAAPLPDLPHPDSKRRMPNLEILFHRPTICTLHPLSSHTWSILVAAQGVPERLDVSVHELGAEANQRCRQALLTELVLQIDQRMQSGEPPTKLLLGCGRREVARLALRGFGWVQPNFVQLHALHSATRSVLHECVQECVTQAS